jgi:glutathione S-transferase
LLEDRLTLADLAVASPFVNLEHLGVDVDWGTHPRTAAFIEAIHARPSFARRTAKEKAFFARSGTQNLPRGGSPPP